MIPNNQSNSQGGSFGRVPFDKERRPSAARFDPTLSAVKRQLMGLGCIQYEIGIFYRAEGKMMIRSWCINQIIENLPKLKYANVKGADVFCRPAGLENQGIILLDDLTRFKVQVLEEQGLKPAVVVETSPQNFQAWIRVCTASLSKEVATQVSKHLANKFEADPNSADWRHFGRLAGFTNRKPEHINRNGQYPWVLIHSYWGKTAPKGPIILEEAKKLHEPPQRDNFEQIPASPGDPVETFKIIFHNLEKRYGAQVDFSRIDWVVVKIMHQRGYSLRDIKLGLEHGSPNIKVRKLGHIEDYISRTCEKAIRNANRESSKRNCPSLTE